MTKFDFGVFSKSLVSVKATRKIGEFLAPFKKEQFEFFIRNHKFITDYIPLSKKMEMKEKAQSYMDVINSYSVNEVYVWIPKEYRELLESLPGGSAWAMAEIEHIRAFLTGA